MTMTAEEIVRHWQQAKKRDAAELRLLAELNSVDKDAIRKILREAGEAVPQERHRRRNEKLYRTIETLYGQRLSDGEIARRAGCSNTAVRSWRKRNGLPRNAEPGYPSLAEQKKEPTAGLPEIYSQVETLLASLPEDASPAVRRRAGDLLADMFGEYLVERLKLREEETT